MKNQNELKTRIEGILITQNAELSIIKHIQYASGREVCGFCLGEPHFVTDNNIMIQAAIAANNTSCSFQAFSISYEDFRRASKAALLNGLEVLAIYHFHPSGIRTLSPPDKASLAASKEHWIIVTLSCSTGLHRANLSAYQAGICKPLSIQTCTLSAGRSPFR